MQEMSNFALFMKYAVTTAGITFGIVIGIYFVAALTSLLGLITLPLNKVKINAKKEDK